MNKKELLKIIKDLVKLQKCYSLKKFSHDEKLYYDKENACFLMTNHQYAMIVEANDEIVDFMENYGNFVTIDINRSTLNIIECKSTDLPDLYDLEEEMADAFDEEVEFKLIKGEDEGVNVGVFLHEWHKSPLNTRYLMAFPYGRYKVYGNDDCSKLVFECENHPMGFVKLFLNKLITK